MKHSLRGKHKEQKVRFSPQSKRIIVISLMLIIGVAVGIAAIHINSSKKSQKEEIPFLRTLNSKTRALPDGTYETTFYQNPIHYKDGQGNLEDIDARITGSTLNGYAYQNTTNVVKSYFKEKNDKDFIRLETEGSTLYYSLAEIQGLGAPRVVTAVVSETEVVYPNVYTGVDVVYVADVSQNKIFFRVNNIEAGTKIKEIPLVIRTENATISQADTGQVYIKNDKGTIAYIAQPFLIEENSVKKPGGNPATTAISYNVASENGQTTVTKVIDQHAHAWLTDSGRKYPVLVDPVTIFYPDPNVETTTVDGEVERNGANETFSAIRSGAGSSADDSTATGIRSARLTASATTNQFQILARSIYLFDTKSIVRGATIISSTLSLYGTNKTTAAGSSPALHIVDSNPASNTALVAGDYSTVGTVSYGNVSYASFSTVGYNDITLTSGAIAQGGISRLGAILSWDQSGTFGGTWTSGGEWSFYADYADQTGTSKDPKLTVTWGVGSLWKFDEGNGSSANDSTGNVNTGTITEALWKTPDTCKSGSCLFFDGSNDVVTVTAASSINMTGNAGYTMCAWVKPLSDGEADTGQVFNKGTSNYLRVDTESSGTVKVSASIDLSTTDATYTSTRTISTSSWSHVCAVYNGSTSVSVYINGTLSGTGTGSGSISDDSGSNLLIGGGTSNNFNGYIDEARVYPIARTAAQIKADYTGATKSQGTGAALGGNKDSGDFLSRGLVGYWKLDESSGNASDSSGKATTLTNVNTTAYAAGKFANGADYESGSSNYHYAADNASLSLTGDVTISAWIKPESVTAATLFDIAGKWDGANESYLLAQYGDEIRYYINSSSNYVTTDSSNLATGSWYHITASYQSSSATVKIFINGILQAATTSGTIPASIDDDVGRFQIGAEDSTTTAANFYDGVIDEVRVYNWAFGDQEALALSEWFPDPTVYYDFNSTSSIIDVAGGESNATISTASWYNASWLYRKKIIIDNTKVDADLTNFPIYFTETSDSDLAAGAQSTGNDILFTNTSGTKLDHELISYTSATGAIEAWVEVDAVANSADTVIYMYYGNSAAAAQQSVNATWGNSYAGVWHLEEASGNVADSTSNGFTGTNANTTTITGKVGAGRDFNGTTAEIDYGVLSGVSFANSYTVEVWAKMDVMGDVGSNCGNLRAALWSKESGTSSIVTMQEYGSSARARHSETLGTTYEAVVSSVAISNWYMFAQVHDNSGNNIHGYKNGALINSASTSTSTMVNPTGASFIQGNLRVNCNHGYVDGIMDELRISTTNRATEWLSTEYNNQNSPSTFYSVGLQTTSTAYALNSVPGKYGLARNIEKDYTDYFYVADNTELSITGSMTMSAWIRPASVTAATTYSIAGKWDGVGGTNQSYLLALYGDEVKFFVDSVSNTETTNAANLTIGTWYHVAAVYNAVAQTVTIYVNGAPQASTTAGTIPASIGDDAGRFQIGAVDTTVSASLNYLYDGDVDELRIYPFVLNSKQVVSVMNATHPAVGTPVGSATGYWRFDDGYGTTANDATNNNNDLTLSAESWINTGKFGTAFNGTNATWASKADDPDFDFAAADSMTVSVWVRSDATGNPGANEYIVSKGAPSAAGYALYFNSSGYPIYAIDDDTSWTTPDFSATYSTDIYDNTWHHIVGVKDAANTIKIYVDGILRATSASIAAEGTLVNASSLVFGDSDATNNGDEFTGDIDEAKIYRYALTSEEIKLEYNHGKAMRLGAQSTTSGTAVPDNSYDREYCVPGDSTACTPPIGHWKMDEGANNTCSGGTADVCDVTGNANDGTKTSETATTWSPGKKGGGLQFDGTANEVTINDTPFDFERTDDFTLEAWIKTTKGNGSVIFNKDDGSQTGYTLFYNDSPNGTVRFWIQSTSTNKANAHSTTPIYDGNWHHIAASYDGTSNTSGMRIYVDGVSDTIVAEANTLTTSILNNNNLKFGCASTCVTSDAWQGNLDDLRVYDYVRTPAQVAWDYNQGKPVGHWKFDECSGTVANDSSGKSLTGTITIGASGTNTSAGSCTGAAGQAWYDGSSGKYNASLEFDGTDDLVTIADSTTLNVGKSYSVSAWIYPTAWGGAGDTYIRSIFSDEYSGSGGTMTLRLGDGNASQKQRLGAFLYDGSNNNFNSSTDLSLNTWYHVMMTYDGANVKLYINGRLDKTTAYTGTPTEASNSWYISRSYDGRFFAGQIDDVRVYNYPLTAVQVKTLYNENSAVRFGPASGSP